MQFFVCLKDTRITLNIVEEELHPSALLPATDVFVYSCTKKLGKAKLVVVAGSGSPKLQLEGLVCLRKRGVKITLKV